MKKLSVFSIAYLEVFGWGLAATLVGFAISVSFFRENILMACTGLTAIFLIPKMNQLLTENRDAIWVHRRSPWEANSVLACKIISIFLSIFFATTVAQRLAPSRVPPLATSAQALLFNNEALPLFLHNLRVLLVAMILSFIYRSGGLLLVICWNAISWSISIFSFIHAAHQAGAKRAWFYALAIVPHLLLESAAYVTAGMSGVFLSKGLFKYKLSSAKFFRVSRACVIILIASVGCLWLAMKFETGLAQAVLQQLRR